jgi:NADPH-dependent F420 reductase
VIIGSRSKDKAQSAARELTAGGAAQIRGEDNLSAAQAGEVVVIAVPWGSHDVTLEEIKSAVAGKIVVDAAVPLMPPKVTTVQLPPEGSAAQVAQRILGPEARVVSAFQNVGAAKLKAGGSIDCDVLVCGNDKAARESVITLADAAGTRGIDAGVLANSAAADALTSLLIGINRRYKAEHAGIRITGLPSSDAN